MSKPIYGGVNAAALTPMGADLAPDLDRMAGHCRWLLSHGCTGLGSANRGVGNFFRRDWQMRRH